MARKRSAEHRAAHDANITEKDLQRHQGGPVEEPDERELRRHSGMPGDDLSEQVRPESEEEPAGLMPSAIDEERDRVAGRARDGGGAPEPEDHDFWPSPLPEGLDDAPPRPEFRRVDTRSNAPGGADGYAVLARRGDISPAGYTEVPLDAAHTIDPAAPVAGEDGGAPLGEETEQKHDPGAPWPAPLQSDAAAPTASPPNFAEPAVQFNPPQDVTFENPPEAAAGVAAPPLVEIDPPPEGGGEGEGGAARSRKPDRTQRFSTLPPEPPRKQSEGEVERDEAGQVSISKMAEKALEGVGGLFKGLGEDDPPQPHRIQKALELAARKVMSSAWWGVKAQHFDGEREPVAAE